MDAEDDLIAAAAPTALVKIAAVAMGLSGVLVALSGLQVAGGFFAYVWLEALAYALLGLGVAQVVLAALVYRARAWAAYLGAANGVLMALAITGWFIATLGSFFSCLVVIAIPVSGLAALLAVAAVFPVRRAAEARQRLADEGLNLGL